MYNALSERLPSHCILFSTFRGTLFAQLRGLGIGVGTAGATGALAPAMLKPRGRKYLLVDSQRSISLYSFKILNLNLIMLFNWVGPYIVLNELGEACKCIKLHAYIWGLQSHTVLLSRTAGQLT